MFINIIKFVALLFVFFFGPFSTITFGEELRPLKNIEAYFPDKVGMTWTYQGTVEDDVMRIASYVNISTVKGWTMKNGVEAKIFTETNQANQGPTESYFSRKEDGIDYHGGDPTTDFEGSLIPYRIIQFPVVLHKSFLQLHKKNIPFGRDFDRDGAEEIADVIAEITAEGFETVSVPAGRFEDALKLKGVMVIRLTLSGSGEVVSLVDRTTTWLALGIGTVKGVESIEFPGIDGQAPTVTIIRELLSDFSEKPNPTH